MASLPAVTDATFESEVLQSETPVVVDFWAEWCGPCKALGPLLESAAAKAKGIKVLKLNIDENLETPTRYGIRSIPTMMAFKGGELADTLVGLRSQNDLESWLNGLAG
jgi:thioredoxin 1